MWLLAATTLSRAFLSPLFQNEIGDLLRIEFGTVVVEHFHVFDKVLVLFPRIGQTISHRPAPFIQSFTGQKQSGSRLLSPHHCIHTMNTCRQGSRRLSLLLCWSRKPFQIWCSFESDKHPTSNACQCWCRELEHWDPCTICCTYHWSRWVPGESQSVTVSHGIASYDQCARFPQFLVGPIRSVIKNSLRRTSSREKEHFLLKRKTCAYRSLSLA